MKTISLKLPESLAELLSKRARELGRSRSDLVRAALEEQLHGSNLASCHDLMHDLCGSFEGASDLSSNPQHLAGFGQ